MSSSFRRLAKDHASLQQKLPPYYLLPETDDASVTADDLTQLSVLITGADGTPYSQGLWRLHLKMPNDYPRNPPRAIFKTRIFHPNVDEQTGLICLETLKRDWDPKLTLKDILVTISCLLIQPNPDSALNATAGALIQEDYEAFSKQAKLMTSIHAPIPKHLLQAVQEAKLRGECSELRPVISADKTGIVGTKQSVLNSKVHTQCDFPGVIATSSNKHLPKDAKLDPAVQLLGTKSVLGKHPLVESSSLANADTVSIQNSTIARPNLKQPEAASTTLLLTQSDEPQQPARKSPKVVRTTVSSLHETSHSTRGHEQVGDPAHAQQPEEKENFTSELRIPKTDCKTPHLPSVQPAARPSLRKVSNVGSGQGKGLPRVGIRRL